MRKSINIFKNFGLVTLAIILSNICGLITLPIYTRLINPGDYGLLALATATLGFLLMLLPMGIHIGSFGAPPL
jgi:O-antigen/teichoic acid export membrane protein